MARRETDTRGMEVGQVSDILMVGDGEIRTENTVEVVGGELNDTYADALAFMEEPVEVIVHETTDENAENPVIVGCNGVFKAFERGKPTVAKRKFVDVLIVKSGRVSTPEILNGAGERAYAIRQQSAHKFPFSVLQDRNPKGAEWLRQRLAQVV